MKKLFLFSLIVFCFSCDEDLNDLTVFDLDTTVEFTVPESSLVDIPFDIATPAIATNSASIFENNSTSTDLIESITLKSMELTVSDPANGNFDFLKEVRIYINADGAEEVEIAVGENIPTTGLSELQLTATGVNLKDYIILDNYSLRIRATTDEAITADYDIEVLSIFSVDANILGF